MGISNMQKVYATATIPQYMIYNFSVAELVRCFSYFSVELRGIRFTNEAIALKIHGTHVDIRLAVKALYTLINQQFKKLAQIETTVAKEIPEELKNYCKDLEDNGQYKKQYDEFTDQYLKHCVQNNIQPHPEVIDGYVF
jgi:hypothetical protein